MDFSHQSAFLLAGLLAATFLFTLPFGAWRARCRRYSLRWWLSIHLAIPFVIFTRVWGGFPGAYIPLFVAATVLGHFVGGRVPRQNIIIK
ncbi:MAG: hypothetical protein JXR72_01980 [Proteobacteria bacterium]|nr:hypothetical protein [Pseudomonadota bacterium]